jgi:antitoxin VapB
MGLNIKNAETHRLAVQLAQLTGETLTRTVTIALKERLEREKRRRNRTGVAEALRQIVRRCASRPLLDDRSPEAILGYDEHGLPR